MPRETSYFAQVFKSQNMVALIREDSYEAANMWDDGENDYVHYSVIEYKTIEEYQQLKKDAESLWCQSHEVDENVNFEHLLRGFEWCQYTYQTEGCGNIKQRKKFSANPDRKN